MFLEKSFTFHSLTFITVTALLSRQFRGEVSFSFGVFKEGLISEEDLLKLIEALNFKILFGKNTNGLNLPSESFTDN